MDLVLVSSVVDFMLANWLAVALAVVSCITFGWRWIGFLFSAAGAKVMLVIVSSTLLS